MAQPRIEILQETLAISEWFQKPKSYLKVFTDNLPARPLPGFRGLNRVLVTQEKVQDAILRYDGKKIVVLNFASATRPGGGVRRGAIAQEEDICLCSNLLPCLESEEFEHYYLLDKMTDSPSVYYDKMIISEDVQFFRDGSGILANFMTDATVITCAAPNLERCNLWDADDALWRRGRLIFQEAMSHNPEVVILGAWGCGVFGNNPETVANVWRNEIDRVLRPDVLFVHPVYGDQKNYDAFKKVFG